MEQPGGQVWVGLAQQKVCVRVEGRATHVHGPQLRDFAKEMMERGHAAFEVDLAKCTYMDSTFLGVLVGISMRLEKAGLARLAICRIGPRNLELLRTLGVERFFDLVSPGAVMERELRGEQPLASGGASREEWASTILAAHQVLVEADDRNEPRFKDLLSYLEEDLGKARGSGGLSPKGRPEPWRS